MNRLLPLLLLLCLGCKKEPEPTWDQMTDRVNAIFAEAEKYDVRVFQDANGWWQTYSNKLTGIVTTNSMVVDQGNTNDPMSPLLLAPKHK